MMNAAAPRGRAGRSLRQNLPWVLAALLGVATVHAITRVVHDTSRRRVAARLVATAMAEQVVTTARQRLEAGAGLALAPSLAVSAGDTGEAAFRPSLTELANRQRGAMECGCLPALPVIALVRLSGEAADFVMVADGASPLTPAQRTVLRRAGGAAVGATGTRSVAAWLPYERNARPVARLWFDPALDSLALVSTVVRDAQARATGVVGLVADRRALMHHLFSRAPAAAADTGLPLPGAAANGAADRARRVHDEGVVQPSSLAELDDRSVEVRDPAGILIFGSADPARRFRATVVDSSVLGGAAVTVALETFQIASPLISPIATPQVWHLAAMLLGAIVATILAVRSARREAQLASARSDFLAAVSHELRMPLAQILLASETLALRRERDEQQRLGLAGSIVREARRLVALVENVLLVSRTGAIELRPRLEPVPVTELFGEVREAVELAVDDAGQTLETVASPNVVVHGDRVLLRQALVNLLDNAIKYGGAGQRIRLLAREASGRVQLVVEDEGRGVPHVERMRVFEPWERLARDQSSERTGTGLGLAVVRQVATACGGRVWLEETEHGGTRAILELPAASAVSPSAAAVGA